MKRYWVEYTAEWKRGPMTFWVHVETDRKPWCHARAFNPPAPKPVAGKGYPYYYVEVDGLTFEFASLHELDVCVATLSQKMLPSTEAACQRALILGVIERRQ